MTVHSQLLQNFIFDCKNLYFVNNKVRAECPKLGPTTLLKHKWKSKSNTRLKLSPLAKKIQLFRYSDTINLIATAPNYLAWLWGKATSMNKIMSPWCYQSGWWGSYLLTPWWSPHWSARRHNSANFLQFDPVSMVAAEFGPEAGGGTASVCTWGCWGLGHC